jgi:hypothetical protein
MKKGDKIIIIIIVILAVLLFGFKYLFNNENDKVAVISINGEVYKTLPMNTDQQITISTEYGYNIVTIKNRQASVIKADCPDKICVHTKAAEDIGDVIVCIPHRFVLTIKKADQ